MAKIENMKYDTTYKKINIMKITIITLAFIKSTFLSPFSLFSLDFSPYSLDSFPIIVSSPFSSFFSKVVLDTSIFMLILWFIHSKTTSKHGYQRNSDFQLQTSRWHYSQQISRSLPSAVHHIHITYIYGYLHYKLANWYLSFKSNTSILASPNDKSNNPTKTPKQDTNKYIRESIRNGGKKLSNHYLTQNESFGFLSWR